MKWRVVNGKVRTSVITETVDVRKHILLLVLSITSITSWQIMCGWGKSAKIAVLTSENERLMNEAVINKDKKNFGMAMSNYTDAINQLETSNYKEDVKELLGNVYVLKGSLHEENGQLSDSLACYKSAVECGNIKALDEYSRLQASQTLAHQCVHNEGPPPSYQQANIPMSPMEQINAQSQIDDQLHRQKMAQNLADNTTSLLTHQAQGNYMANTAEHAIELEKQALASELMDDQQRKFFNEQMEAKKNLLSNVQAERASLTTHMA
jgi:hypothetical protein